MEAFLIVVPIFLIVLAGWIFRRFQVVQGNWTHALNMFVYHVALPALIISSFWQIDFRDPMTWSFVGMNLFALACFVFVAVVTVYLLRLKPDLKAATILAAIVGNTVYMGFPIGERAFGHAFGDYVALSGALSLALGLVVATCAIEFLKVKSRRVREYLIDFVKNPLVIGLVAGVVLSLVDGTGRSLDSFRNAISMLGSTASPVALFALGLFLAERPVLGNLRLPLVISGLKILGFPIVTWLVLFLIAPTETTSSYIDLASVLVVVSAMPVAVSTFVIAEKYRLNKVLVANSILISTIVSLLTIPVFLALL